MRFVQSDAGSEESTVSDNLIQWSRWARPLAWAAIIAFVFGIVWQGAIPAVRKSQWHASDSVGSVIRKAGGELSVSGLNIQLATGDSIKPGEYVLTDGMVQFALANDVEVLVETPARFRVDSPMLMALYEGRLPLMFRRRELDLLLRRLVRRLSTMVRNLGLRLMPNRKARFMYSKERWK
jgi:hypothetical protein